MAKVNTHDNKIGFSKKLETKRAINGRLLLTVSISSLMILSVSLTPSINTVNAQNTNQSSSNMSSSTTTTTTTADKSGTLASIHNGPDDKPAWRVSGTWDFKALNSNSRTFTGTFGMMKLGGSAAHKHNINDFKLAGDSPTKTSTESTYNGTAIVSMKEEPISNVPLSIKLSDNGNISIMVDPKITNNHFANTPIQGKATI